MTDTEPRNAGTFDYLRRLGESGFWGSITLKFENGLVVHLKKEENLKPSELSGKTEVVQCDPIQRNR
jgi:hypothetical protein